MLNRLKNQGNSRSGGHGTLGQRAVTPLALLVISDFLIRIGNLGDFLAPPRKRVWHLFLFCRSGLR